MTDTKVLVKKRFATAAAWQDWLEKHLCFGWIDGQTKSGADGWWCQRFTPRGPRSKWSQVNCAAVERLRAQGKLTAAGFSHCEEVLRIT
jgi:uncharacterized protein YdeI (YjbR/CyaY-like superfamily)